MNLLLNALTYSRAGNWALFERLSAQLSDDPWFPIESARLLAALGHIDLSLDSLARPIAWSISPSTICSLPGGDAILCGARSHHLLASLDLELEALGRTAAVEHDAGAPDLIRIPQPASDDLARLADTLTAKGFEIKVSAAGARHIASLLPALSDVGRSLTTVRRPAIAVERFDLTSNKWQAATAVDQAGAYKLLTRPLRFGVAAASDGGALRIADSRTVKWLAANEAGTNLMAYEPSTETLTCRLGAQLPGLYERVAVLCSGKAPTPHKNGTVTYADVPEDIAATLWISLGPR
jgi:hypothetical protein